jgi:hypothetical protein
MTIINATRAAASVEESVRFNRSGKTAPNRFLKVRLVVWVFNRCD